MNCDVLIIGGGAAGTAAAIAAGRTGAHVLLLERCGFLGGVATAAEVGTICGLYLRNVGSSRPSRVAAGFPVEFAERLSRASATEPLCLSEGLWVLPYRPWAFERTASSLVGEVKTVTLGLHSTVTGVAVNGRRVTEVRAIAWNELVAIHPRCVVDCSGEAIAAALAGAPVEDGSNEQTPGLVFEFENVVGGFAGPGWIGTLRGLRRAVEQRELPEGCDRLSVVPGSGVDGRVAFKLGLQPAQPSPPRWRQVTEWEQHGRARVEAIRRFLLEKDASFRRAHLSHVAAQVGIRSGRRLSGLARLEEADVTGARKCRDGIARGCWPVERWGPEPRPEMKLVPEGDFYDIPLGCLRTGSLDNLLAAGRCLSASADAMASARVIGTALATGWAAGRAAAACAESRPFSEAVAAVRLELNGDRTR